MQLSHIKNKINVLETLQFNNHLDLKQFSRLFVTCFIFAVICLQHQQGCKLLHKLIWVLCFEYLLIKSMKFQFETIGSFTLLFWVPASFNCKSFLLHCRICYLNLKLYTHNTRTTKVSSRVIKVQL